MLSKIISLLIIVFLGLANASNFSLFKENNVINLDIKYLNTGGLSLENLRSKNRKFFKRVVAKTPITIFSNIHEINVLDPLSLPAKPFYIGDEKNGLHVVYLNDNANEFFNIEPFIFEDRENLFGGMILYGFMINKRYAVYLLNISEKTKEERLSIVSKVPLILKWTRSQLHIRSRDTFFIGDFNLSRNEIIKALYGNTRFVPLLKHGNKIIRYKGKYKYKMSENVIVDRKSDISAEIDFFAYQPFVKNRGNKKWVLQYIKNVSNYMPIDIHLKGIKLKKIN